MEKQKLTFLQKIAYAHWSAKCAFAFPNVGLILIVMLIYLGVALWFFEPEIRSWEHFTGPHAMAKTYFCRVGGVLLIVALSNFSVYLLYFIEALLYRDEADCQYFLKYHYRKH